jgi:hypothetical protein
MSMTNVEVLALAQSTGTNLYDATKSYGELAQSIAKGLMHTVHDLRNAAGDRLAGDSGLFSQEIERLGAPKIIDEIQTNLLDNLATGDFDTETALADFESLISGYISLADGNEDLAEQIMAGTLGVGGSAWQEGGALGPELLAALTQNQDFADWQTGITGRPGEQAADTREALLGNLMSAGFAESAGPGMGGMPAAMGAQLMRMLGPDASYEQLLQVREAGLLDQSNYYKEGTDERKSPEEITAMFAQAGLMDLLVKQTTDWTPAAAIKDSSEIFRDAVIKFADKIDDVLQVTDTATPRRAMVGMRGVLAKRSNMFMPSGSDSDHLAGAANDYYGSGLGAIQSSVTAAGGFAERHGRGPSRHLHAVEGGGGGQGAVSNYTINVSGGASASPAEIADEVMYRIQRQQVNQMERT